MIEEIYVSLEVARLLREKRFDETCRAYWGGFIDKPLYLCECNRGKFFDYCRNSWLKVNVCDDEQDYMAAPTQQMVMKWLREKYNLVIMINPQFHYTDSNKDKTFFDWYYCIDYVTNESHIHKQGDFSGFKTYEEAVEAAIKYCLENLI